MKRKISRYNVIKVITLSMIICGCSLGTTEKKQSSNEEDIISHINDMKKRKISKERFELHIDKEVDASIPIDIVKKDNNNYKIEIIPNYVDLAMVDENWVNDNRCIVNINKKIFDCGKVTLDEAVYKVRNEQK